MQFCRCARVEYVTHDCANGQIIIIIIIIISSSSSSSIINNNLYSAVCIIGVLQGRCKININIVN